LNTGIAQIPLGSSVVKSRWAYLIVEFVVILISSHH